MTPSYSILLPTRNGATLLEGCLRSMLEQDYDDFELVVSDNASEDGTPDILARFASHPRLRVIRQPEPLGVTDNWNATLAASTGDWIAVLGDDDALLPGYFQRADALLERHGEPDVLLFNGSAFAYPGFAGSPESNYADPFYVPAPPIPAEGELSPQLRRRLVEHLFRFDFPIPLNLQTALVARRAISRLPGGLFKPPFPDFYALIGLMLADDVRWAISPERLVVVGVSPKSFGRTVHSSHAVREAQSYLGIDTRFAGLLPGSTVMTGHYETLAILKADFGPELAGVEIDRQEYAWQQVYAWYVQRRLGSLTNREIAQRARLLRPGDWAGLVRLLAKRLRPGVVRRRIALGGDAATSALWPGMRPAPDVHDIVQFVSWIEARRPRQAISA